MVQRDGCWDLTMDRTDEVSPLWVHSKVQRAGTEPLVTHLCLCVCIHVTLHICVCACAYVSMYAYICHV